jgi:transposase
MRYVGIDVAKVRHAVAGMDETGQEVLGARFVGNDAGGYAAFTGELRKLGTCQNVLIGMEATGHYGNLFLNRLRADGWTVHLFNPLVTAAAADGDVRGRKTDKRDAWVIARLLREGRGGQTRVAPAEEEKLKALCRQRRFLVGLQTEAKNRLRALLDTLFPEVMSFFHEPFAPTLLALVARYPSASVVAQAHGRSLAVLLDKASHGQCGPNDAREIKKAAENSLARTCSNPGAEFAAQQTCVLIRQLDEQLVEIERQIRACHSPVAMLLGSIKGFGPILPLLVAGELGNLDRFAGRHMAKKILAFAGCDPRVRESGKWKGRSKTSKRGSTALRSALYHAAQTVRLCSPAFGRIYQTQTGRGKHHIVAQFHVIRAIINTLCGMYKTQTFYTAPLTAGDT